MDGWPSDAVQDAQSDRGAEPPANLTPKQLVAFQQSGPGARRRPGLTGWDVLLAVDLIALLLLLTGAGLLASQGGDAEAPPLTTGVLWVEIAFSFIAFTIIPLAWVAGTRAEAWAGTLRYLGLYDFWPSVGRGALWALAVLAGTIALVYGYDALGGSIDNPGVDQIRDAITWPTAIGLSLAAGIGEEVLFRGILQKRIGLLGQAVVFGLAHVAYGTVLQIAMPFLLALFFGYLVRRGNSLWVPIVAHILFDLVALMAPDVGG